MKITFWSAIFFLIQCNCVYSQDFRKVRPSEKEKAAGVMTKYTSEKDASLSDALLLYKNGFFFLAEGTDVDYVYSKGYWKQMKDTVVLVSFFSKKKLQIKINYIDTVDKAQNQLFHVVKNIEGVPLTDAFVQINDSATEYLPLADIYTSKPEKIDSVRVRFESGFVSEWAKVANRPYKALSIIVQTSMSMKNFIVFDEIKFIKNNGQLLRIK